MAIRQPPDALAPVREAAVLDVGSNSVRLVAYRIDGRALTPFLNEKVMAGLGRNLRAAGRLSPEGAEAALSAMRRFRTLLDALGVSDVEGVATAAVRDAADGADFVARAHRETGLKLKIISGADEARLSAVGVLAGAPEARGVVGDLGGSSLELIEIGARGPGRGETHPLGPLSLMSAGPFDADRIAAAADAVLQRSSALAGAQGGDFFAVGGAWRALGRIDIALRLHPIGVLHHHEMSRAEALKVVEFVRKQSRKSLERFEEAAAKRAESLPYAAVVLERVLRWGGFERVVLSSYGLREGVLAERLPETALRTHPLVAGAEAFGAPGQRARAFGRALDAWIAPVRLAGPVAFSKDRDALVWAAACRMADLGAALHPDQRGEIMFDLVLRAPLAAVSHAERAFLAAAVHHRYTKSPPEAEQAFQKLLTDDQRRAAALCGASMRLGADLSGRSQALLADFTLKITGDGIVVSARKDMLHLLTDQAVKRLEPVAALLGLEAREG
jgi:exopolyphosphatase/guanosine-5'-triphosphate,3'-diphosphate pyrophosphatase